MNERNKDDFLSDAAKRIIQESQRPRPKANFGKIIEPGDKGFNENIIYPWTLPGEAAGYEQKNISIEIHGFVVLDRRASPHLMVFKNAKVPMIQNFHPPLSEEPKPFESYWEAKEYIEKLHLSTDQERYLEVSALAPDPGFGRPKPDTLIMTTKKDLKGF